MKLSAAAFFLIVAAGLGSQAQVIRESLAAMRPFESSIHTESFHRPTDCCFSYTTRNIRCVFMQDYYVTSSECSMPAVIFFTKKRQQVCANPRDERVRSCMSYLQQTQRTQQGAEKMGLA